MNESFRPKPAEELDSQKLFDQLWEQRNLIGAEPITLKGKESSYGLPLSLGLRQVANYHGFNNKSGFVLGIFEDRSDLRPHQTLADIFNPEKNYYSLPSEIRRPQVMNRSVKSVEPVGWLVLEQRPESPRKFISHTSELIGKGRHISLTSLGEDPYFLSFSKVRDINSITVGFSKSLESRRSLALQRLPENEQNEFTNYSFFTADESILNTNRYKELQKKVHQKQGLAGTLMKQAILLSKRLNLDSIYFQYCSDELEKFLQSYSKKFKLNLIKHSLDCWEIKV